MNDSLIGGLSFKREDNLLSIALNGAYRVVNLF